MGFNYTLHHQDATWLQWHGHCRCCRCLYSAYNTQNDQWYLHIHHIQNMSICPSQLDWHTLVYSSHFIVFRNLRQWKGGEEAKEGREGGRMTPQIFETWLCLCFLHVCSICCTIPLRWLSVHLPRRLPHQFIPFTTPNSTCFTTCTVRPTCCVYVQTGTPF